MSKFNIVWAFQAKSDLRAIRSFIAADAPQRAASFVRQIKAAVEPLRKFPEMGQVVPELGDPTIREIRVGYYRIVYRVQTGRIEVMTVHHGARLFPPDL